MGLFSDHEQAVLINAANLNKDTSRCIDCDYYLKHLPAIMKQYLSELSKMISMKRSEDRKPLACLFNFQNNRPFSKEINKEIQNQLLQYLQYNSISNKCLAKFIYDLGEIIMYRRRFLCATLKDQITMGIKNNINTNFIDFMWTKDEADKIIESFIQMANCNAVSWYLLPQTVVNTYTSIAKEPMCKLNSPIFVTNSTNVSTHGALAGDTQIATSGDTSVNRNVTTHGVTTNLTNTGGSQPIVNSPLPPRMLQQGENNAPISTSTSNGVTSVQDPTTNTTGNATVVPTAITTVPANTINSSTNTTGNASVVPTAITTVPANTTNSSTNITGNATVVPTAITTVPVNTTNPSTNTTANATVVPTAITTVPANATITPTNEPTANSPVGPVLTNIPTTTETRPQLPIVIPDTGLHTDLDTGAIRPTGNSTVDANFVNTNEGRGNQQTNVTVPTDPALVDHEAIDIISPTHVSIDNHPHNEPNPNSPADDTISANNLEQDPANPVINEIIVESNGTNESPNGTVTIDVPELPITSNVTTPNHNIGMTNEARTNSTQPTPTPLINSSQPPVTLTNNLLNFYGSDNDLYQVIQDFSRKASLQQDPSFQNLSKIISSSINQEFLCLPRGEAIFLGNVQDNAHLLNEFYKPKCTKDSIIQVSNSRVMCSSCASPMNHKIAFINNADKSYSDYYYAGGCLDGVNFQFGYNIDKSGFMFLTFKHDTHDLAARCLSKAVDCAGSNPTGLPDCPKQSINQECQNNINTRCNNMGLYKLVDHIKQVSQKGFNIYPQSCDYILKNTDLISPEFVKQCFSWISSKLTLNSLIFNDNNLVDIDHQLYSSERLLRFLQAATASSNIILADTDPTKNDTMVMRFRNITIDPAVIEIAGSNAISVPKQESLLIELNNLMNSTTVPVKKAGSERVAFSKFLFLFLAILLF
jgi:hypothetical protein